MPKRVPDAVTPSGAIKRALIGGVIGGVAGVVVGGPLLLALALAGMGALALVVNYLKVNSMAQGLHDNATRKEEPKETDA
jgi:hypothetical protein